MVVEIAALSLERVNSFLTILKSFHAEVTLWILLNRSTSGSSGEIYDKIVQGFSRLIDSKEDCLNLSRLFFKAMFSDFER